MERRVRRRKPDRAWARSAEVAQQAERIADSIWLFDHFHTVPKPTDELTFESLTSLSALAALTRRVHLGHLVICNGFRHRDGRRILGERQQRPAMHPIRAVTIARPAHNPRRHAARVFHATAAQRA